MSLDGDWIAQVPDYLLAANISAITSLADLLEEISMGMIVGGSSTEVPGVVHAFIILNIYRLIFIVITFYLFRK
jgi:hypothetical protein